MKFIVNRKLKRGDGIAPVIDKVFVYVPNTVDLGVVERILERHQVVFVVDPEKGATVDVKYITPV